MTDLGNTDNAATVAEEDFVVEIQVFLHQLMEKKGISRADLARAMGVSRARVTQIFSDECTNFTIRLLARAVNALGETPAINYKQVEKVKRSSDQWSASMLFPEDLERAWQIQGLLGELRPQQPCNDQGPKRLVGYDYSSLEWEAA